MQVNPQQIISINPREATLEYSLDNSEKSVLITFKNLTEHQMSITPPTDKNQTSITPPSAKTVIVAPFEEKSVMYKVKCKACTDTTIRTYHFTIQVQDAESTQFTEVFTLKWVVPTVTEKSNGPDPRECPICYRRFNENERAPRMYTCGHTHCHSCTVELLKRKYTFNGRSYTSCPSCNQLLIVGEGKSAGNVPKNFISLSLMDQMEQMEKKMAELEEEPPAKKLKLAEPFNGIQCAGDPSHEGVLYCTNCKHSLCQDCSNQLHNSRHSLPNFSNHVIYPVSDVPLQFPNCPRHFDRTAEFLCTDDTCKSRKTRKFCSLCLNGEHAGHRFELLSERITKKKDVAGTLLPRVSAELERIDDLLKDRKRQLEAHCKDGESSKKREEEINEFYENKKARALEDFHDFLEDETDNILNDMKKLTEDKKRFEAVQKELKSATSPTNSSLGLVQDARVMARDAFKKGLSCEDVFTTSLFRLPENKWI